MTDDDNALASPGGLDWTRLAHELSVGGRAYAGELADGTPLGAQRAALVSALTAALHFPDPSAPGDTDVERVLATILARRDTVAIRASAVRRAAGRRWTSPWLAAAAVVIVAAGALLMRRATEAAPSPALASTSTAARTAARIVATSVGQVDSVRLADGSLVVLAPQSRIEVRADGATGAREVTLRGEAFFDVVHDASRPFVIHTARGIVRDVGTSFVVNADASAGLVVAVRSGAVAVSRTGAASDEQVVSAGDRATLADRGALVVARGTSTDADLAFRRGHLALHDASVADVRDAMRRWYGLDFRVTDSTLLGRRVTASFDGESGADAARIVAAAMGGSARLLGDTVLVAGGSTGVRTR